MDFFEKTLNLFQYCDGLIME